MSSIKESPAPCMFPRALADRVENQAKEALEKFSSYAIVDDLLATGGSVDCVTRIVNKSGKRISGLLTVVELIELNGRMRFDFPVESILSI